MESQVHYQFFQSDQLISEGTVEAPFVVGRQSEGGEPSPVSVFDPSLAGSGTMQVDRSGLRKLVVVSLSDRTVPRLFLRIELDANGKLVVHNTHRNFDVQLANSVVVPPGKQVSLGKRGSVIFCEKYQLRLALSRSTATLSVSPVRRDSNLNFTVLSAGDQFADQNPTNLLTMIQQDLPSSRGELAIRLVRTVLEAFKAPPGSDECFSAAGAAAIKMIDLDRVAVLIKEGKNWRCRTQSFRDMTNPSESSKRPFSQSLLSNMESVARTTVMEPNFSGHHLAASMVNIDRAVASPIFDEKQAIVGALYGDRVGSGSNADRPIGELEAAMLDVLASGISSNLAIQNEQRLRSSMSPFFSPVVLAQLNTNQQLLESREADVSVLFCDIRGFSSVTEKIGPTMAIGWINDVLTALSECVLNHDGVLVDYVGDELMAMFGAPAHQPDHAQRACRAAMEMLSQIVPLGKKWKDTVPNRFGFGIGINSGTASVGNTGSQKKFKYGPLGNTVNLASRVQGITKQIGVPGLITGETANAIGREDFQIRRLAKVRVVGIEGPIDLFQLCENHQHRELCVEYEKALMAFEQRDLNLAARLLASVLQDYPADRPTIILLNRTAEILSQSEREFDTVWSLTQK